MWPAGRMQPRMAVKAARHTVVNLLKIGDFVCLFSLVFVYLMCGSRQLFLQCGPETPKGWTPLRLHLVLCMPSLWVFLCYKLVI